MSEDLIRNICVAKLKNVCGLNEAYTKLGNLINSSLGAVYN